MELSSESYGIVLEPGYVERIICYNVDFICRRTHLKIITKAAVSTFNIYSPQSTSRATEREGRGVQCSRASRYKEPLNTKGLNVWGLHKVSQQ